jgi:hypothetical protein
MSTKDRIGDCSLTTSSFGKFSQSKESVIARNGLEGDIAVPFATSWLLESFAVVVQYLPLLGADNADLVVVHTLLSTRVGNRVNVKSGSLGLPRKLTQSLDEFFLQVIVKAVLLAEEDHPTLRDYTTMWAGVHCKDIHTQKKSTDWSKRAREANHPSLEHAGNPWGWHWETRVQLLGSHQKTRMRLGYQWAWEEFAQGLWVWYSLPRWEPPGLFRSKKEPFGWRISKDVKWVL